MSLEVYVDNEKFETKKRYKTLGLAIKEISSQLIKNRKVATHIFVNGEELSEKTFMYSKKNVLEFKTKKESWIVLEGIYNMKKYHERYFHLIEELEYEDEIPEDEICQELMDISVWFIKHLDTFKGLSTIDMVDSEFDDNLEQLQDMYMDIKLAFEQGDMDVILEILQYEIPNILSRVAKRSEVYSHQFFQDQKGAEFLN